MTNELVIDNNRKQKKFASLQNFRWLLQTKNKRRKSKSIWRCDICRSRR